MNTPEVTRPLSTTAVCSTYQIQASYLLFFLAFLLLRSQLHVSPCLPRVLELKKWRCSTDIRNISCIVYLRHLIVGLKTTDGSAGVVQTDSSRGSEKSVVWVHQSSGTSTSVPQLLVGVLVQLLQTNNSLWVHCWFLMGVVWLV